MATKIYIDQGHNPRNPNAGAEGNGLREQDIVFRVGIALRDLLLANGNFEVRLSRPTAETQIGTSNSSSLRMRVNDANSWGADYFISLHTNAATSAAATGSEGFVYSQPSVAYDFAEQTSALLLVRIRLQQEQISSLLLQTQSRVFRRSDIQAS